MYATRILCMSSKKGGFSGIPKLLLPPPTFGEIASSALQGAWAHVTSQESRDLYETMVADGVIKDSVLYNATNGSTMTYALFHNLQNPLLVETKFDAKEFMNAVEPALENFQDTLGKLRTELIQNLESDKAQLDEKLKKTDEEIIQEAKGNMTEALLGVNLWRKKAEQDPKSLAGVLSQMTTEPCFDALYYTSKIDILSWTQGEVMTYEDCSVNEVALLSARAAVIRENQQDAFTTGEDFTEEYPEFKASDESEQNKERNIPIGAQMDVLFEVTQTFTATQVNSDNTNSTEQQANDYNSTSANYSAIGTQSNGDEKETNTSQVTVTHLAVAIFEGWLRGGPMKELQWKLALIRDAFEFPDATPSVTRQ